jgi:hypothetical protein
MVMLVRVVLSCATSIGAIAACGSDDVSVGSAGSSDGSGPTSTASSSTQATATAPGSADDSGSTGTPPGTATTDTLDPSADTGPPPECARDEPEPPEPCIDRAPVDSFEPVLQWSWSGDGEYRYSNSAPVVGNITDDDGDGDVDLDDVPDIVVSVFRSKNCCAPTEAYLYALDGATGTPHWRSEVDVEPLVMTPALGDLDDDGRPEIVAVRPGGAIVVFDGAGQVVWEAGHVLATAAVALADLDNSGEPEIIVGDTIHSADGTFMGGELDDSGYLSSIAVDLDDDMDLEVVSCFRAMHHDGSILWTLPDGQFAQAQVADFDGDPDPEVLCMTESRTVVLEADGEVVYEIDDGNFRHFPATVYDLDGDGSSDFAHGSVDTFFAFHADGDPMWTATVNDQSSAAGATAFDLLGDGTADVAYADHVSFYLFDGASGDTLFQADRSSGTALEYPVVADVDNDGAAEVVVVTDYDVPDLSDPTPVQTAPTVRVFRDVRDRWMPARRIWNQHSYHVTNVREDGSIPQCEPPHWRALNTFRAQARLGNDGRACRPEPEG